MKISNSKKQLAKIISENGGWPHNAEFAAQCKSDNTVSFYGGEAPERTGNCWWGSHCDGWDISVDQVLPNWHQTILSRDEYFRLYPAPDADGWIEWKGGECPVEDDAIVDVKTRDGEIEFDMAYFWNWSHEQGLCIHARQITAYRLHKQEVEAPQQEEPEPTIEQLTSDYKAKLAIAKHAQEEADSHRCGAEAALQKLHQAGLLIGLDIAIANDEPEAQEGEPFNITDWHDLLVGDVVEYIDGGLEYMRGVECVVVGFDENDLCQPVKVHCDKVKSLHDAYPTKWKFIRRP